MFSYYIPILKKVIPRINYLVIIVIAAAYKRTGTEVKYINIIRG